MTRALIIKTYGDAEISGAIEDAVTKVIPLNDGELAEVRREYAKLQARDGVRSYGDAVRWETVQEALTVKYSPKPHGRLYTAILTVWGTLWSVIYEWTDYLDRWNREG